MTIKRLSFISSLSSREGFTLIELMVVFSIAVLITGVGFASLLSYSRRQEVSQANANLKQIFRQAKFNALSFVKPSNCQMGDPLNSYTVVLNATGYKLTALCGTTTVTIATKDLPQNISYYNTSDACSQVTYQTLSGGVVGTDDSPLPCSVGIQGYGIQQCFQVDKSGNTNDISCSGSSSPENPPPGNPPPPDLHGCPAQYACPADPQVYAGNTNYYTTPNACGNWDYNCNGSVDYYTGSGYKATSSVTTIACNGNNCDEYDITANQCTGSSVSGSTKVTQTYAPLTSSDCNGSTVNYVGSDAYPHMYQLRNSGGTCTGSSYGYLVQGTYQEKCH